MFCVVTRFPTIRKLERMVNRQMVSGLFRQRSEAMAACAKRRLRGLTALAACLFLAQGAWAQQTASQYIEYPQIQGKVQPLQLSGVPKWATIDFQLRGRLEEQTSDAYVSGNGQTYFLTRIYGGLEVRPTKWLSGYVQFMDAHALGLPLKYVAANQRDVFDDRQAYLDFHVKQFKVIAGRQELKYGGERLVGISDWTNTSRTFDGFLGRWGDKNRIDVFSTSVVAVHATSLDKHGAGLNYHGAVGTIGTWVPHMVIQPFVFVKALPRVQGANGVFGTETEVTPGAEAAGNMPGGFDFDVLGALQRGSYANESIDAAAGYVKAGYGLKRVAWKPRLRGEYDYASGNPHTDPLRMGTFDQQYPSNHNAFGLTDLFGFQNIKEERLNLDLTPLKHLAVLIQEESLQVATRFDNVYSGSAGTTVKAPTGGFRSGDIGHEFDASGKYVFHDSLVLNVGVGHLSSGTLLRENTHGAPLTLAYFGLTYRFKVDAKAPAAAPAP
jgi:Alginate export